MKGYKYTIVTVRGGQKFHFWRDSRNNLICQFIERAILYRENVEKLGLIKEGVKLKIWLEESEQPLVKDTIVLIENE